MSTRLRPHGWKFGLGIALVVIVAAIYGGRGSQVAGDLDARARRVSAELDLDEPVGVHTERTCSTEGTGVLSLPERICIVHRAVLYHADYIVSDSRSPYTEGATVLLRDRRGRPLDLHDEDKIGVGVEIFYVSTRLKGSENRGAFADMWRTVRTTTSNERVKHILEDRKYLPEWQRAVVEAVFSDGPIREDVSSAAESLARGKAPILMFFDQRD